MTTLGKGPVTSVLHLGRKAVDGIVFIEKTVAVILLLNVLISTFVQVVARFVFDSPFMWTDELARFSYVWLVFIAAAAVMSQRGHITVELGDQILKHRGRIVLNIVGMAAVVISCAMLAIGSLDFLEHRASGTSPALGLPMAVFYGTVWFGVLLIGIHALVNVLLLTGEALLGDEEIEALESRTSTRPEESI